jgi:hypothetical protein
MILLLFSSFKILYNWVLFELMLDGFGESMSKQSQILCSHLQINIFVHYYIEVSSLTMLFLGHWVTIGNK